MPEKGPSGPVPISKALNCPSCGAALVVRAAGHRITVALLAVPPSAVAGIQRRGLFRLRFSGRLHCQFHHRHGHG